MKKSTLLFIAVLSINSFVFGQQGGTLTTVPGPIVPNQNFTMHYNGIGTGFQWWTPLMFIHTWLEPKPGLLFTKAGNYADNPWLNIAGDADYLAMDNKWKMTYDNSAGQYFMTINNLFDYFNVLDVDKAKIGTMGVIVRAQWGGNDNQTISFSLNVGDAATGINNVVNNLFISTENNVLKVNFEGKANVQLFTITGKLISTANVENEFTQKIKSGFYLLRLNNETHKILVE